MKRRGQVTLLIIVTIVLLAIILIIYSLVTQTNLIRIGQSKISPEIQPIYNILNDCIKQRAIDAIWLVGLQGGYVVLPASYIQTEVSRTAYGIWNDQNILPSLNDIEKEIEDYIEITIPYCINENNYPDFVITQRESDVNIDVSQDSVSLKIELPTTITNGEKTTEFNNPYNLEIPIRLKEVHETANNLIKNQISNPNFIDISYLTNLEMDAVFIPIDNQTLIYIITDEDSKVNGIPYSFAFGYRNENF